MTRQTMTPEERKAAHAAASRRYLERLTGKPVKPRPTVEASKAHVARMLELSSKKKPTRFMP